MDPLGASDLTTREIDFDTLLTSAESEKAALFVHKQLALFSQAGHVNALFRKNLLNFEGAVRHKLSSIDQRVQSAVCTMALHCSSTPVELHPPPCL